MRDVWYWVTAVWLGVCLCGALAAAKLGFAEHDFLLLAVASAASICLVGLIAGPAASGFLRRRSTSAAAVTDRRRERGGG
ncbi:MAG: hypothetical protein QOH72_4835 [Solirubrobacteraceae bacterium]|jgi:hypothetical protein|nr:hypothetical protein [Solirubrobacteraceae bacterium]